MSEVVKLTGLDGRELAPGVRMRPLFGIGVMLNLLDFEPHARVPEHHHPHEQLGLVIDGALTLRIDAVDHLLGPGDGYAIEGDVPHAAWTDERGCRVLDVFHPVREDYREAGG